MILGAAVDLRLPLLPAETLHLRHGQALHAQGCQRLAHIVQLEGFDAGNDQLHLGILTVGARHGCNARV